MIGNLKISTKARVRYEYKCPFCGCKNIRYEKCERIVCDCCQREFIPDYVWVSWWRRVRK